MMVLALYFLANQCEAEIWLNDIPVFDVRPGQHLSGSTPATVYLQDGKNELRLIVHPSSKIDATGGSPEVTAWVGEADDGASSSGQDKSLLKAEWKNGSTEPGQTVVIVRNEKNLGGVSIHPHWQKADALTLDEKNRKEALAVLQELHTAFQKGDGDVVVHLSHLKLEDGVAAFPSRGDIGVLGKQQKDAISRMAKTPGWSLVPINPAQVDLRLVAGGRLIECRSKDGQSALHTDAGAGKRSTSFRTFLGRINGKMEVLL